MRLSTRGRYGLHAMYYLALHYGEVPIALSEVAEGTGLSEHYLEQLVRNLKKAGLVQSVRGAQGGYLLAKRPDEITVGEILMNLETFFGPTECSLEDGFCSREKTCPARDVWKVIHQGLTDAANSMTLADMVGGRIQEIMKQRGCSDV